MPTQADPTIPVGATTKATNQPTSLLDFQGKDRPTASVSCDGRELPLNSSSGQTTGPMEASSPVLSERSALLGFPRKTHPL